jgi:16S rRNA (adenine1518-N6/adenine1519-N6)-dimethyltransferase
VKPSPKPLKSLGQHWLSDDKALVAICDAAEVGETDTVLEIGPGLGTLTSKLVKRAREVVAVEFDNLLATELPYRVPDENLRVISQDIMSFDLTAMAKDYKIVANIPYYLTSNLIRVISESVNRPEVAVLLVQQEVAERVAAGPGDMSLLSVSAQYYWEVSKGQVVLAELFEPPPKVDSQILILHRRNKSLFNDVDEKVFFKIVKAGFSNRRKTLHNSLAGGLQQSKQGALEILRVAGINPQIRPQELSLEDWHKLYLAVSPKK